MAFLRALGVVGFLFLVMSLSLSMLPSLASGEDHADESAKVEECPFPEQLEKFKAGQYARFERAFNLEKTDHENYVKQANLALRGKIAKAPPGYEPNENEPPIYASKRVKLGAIKQFRERAVAKIAELDALIEDRAWVGGSEDIPREVGQFMSHPSLYKVMQVFDTKRFAVRQEERSQPFVIVEGFETSKLADDQRVTLDFPAYVSGTETEGGRKFLVLRKIPSEWLANTPMPPTKFVAQISKWKTERQNVLDRIDKEIEKLSD